MKVRTIALALSALTLSAAPIARADADAAVGVWQVYDDRTGAPDGRVRTFVRDGKLVGVVDALRPDVPPDSRCTACKGAQKDQPILGLTVLWGLQKDGDAWTGGTILEPPSGSTYGCRVKAASPDTLEVRGYLGISLLGRTQTWRRVR